MAACCRAHLPHDTVIDAFKMIETAPTRARLRLGRLLPELSLMPRFTTICMAASAAATLMAAAPAQAGYYILRWDNTGVCQVWSEAFAFKPVEWPSGYKVISRPVPTFNDAVTLQVKLRREGRCTL